MSSQLENELLVVEPGDHDMPSFVNAPVKPIPMRSVSIKNPPSYNSIKKGRRRHGSEESLTGRQASSFVPSEDSAHTHKSHRSRHSQDHTSTAARQPRPSRDRHSHHHGDGRSHTSRTSGSGVSYTSKALAQLEASTKDSSAENVLSRQYVRRATPPNARRNSFDIINDDVDIAKQPKEDERYLNSRLEVSKAETLAVKEKLARRGYVSMKVESTEAEKTSYCTVSRGIMALIIIGIIVLIALFASGIISTGSNAASNSTEASTSLPFRDVLPKGRSVRNRRLGCEIETCTSPTCACPGTRVPPYPMPIADVPQLIMLTFDNRVTDHSFEYYSDLFNGQFKNPNECPIKSTFYIAHYNTNYRLVQELYHDHHEIASHAITYDVQDWEAEIVGQREIIRNFAYIRSDQIRGFRAPNLTPGGDTMAIALQENGFEHDSSLIETGHPPKYPYTFEYRRETFCHVQPCPYENSYPNLWELPITQWRDPVSQALFGAPYEFVPSSRADAKEYFWANFRRHYDIDRAPFNLNLHTQWFDEAGYIFTALKEFIAEVLELGDVYFVTQHQAVQWMKSPIPSFNTTLWDFLDCQYEPLPEPNPCFIAESNKCTYEVDGEVLVMETCAPCPPHFPSIYNTDGTKG
eukprot:m.137364 g.137364  ORF g.137364 m.137364 type:complete len:635 (-) comp11620_c0_seq1:373-2277(-)